MCIRDSYPTDRAPSKVNREAETAFDGLALLVPRRAEPVPREGLERESVARRGNRRDDVAALQAAVLSDDDRYPDDLAAAFALLRGRQRDLDLLLDVRLRHCATGDGRGR